MPGERARDHTFPRSVGVLGLQPIAVPVIRRLRQQLPSSTQVSVFDQAKDATTRALVSDLVGLGARAAVSPADLAARSEFIIVLLEGVDALERGLGGPSGLQAGVHSPTTLIIGGHAAPDLLRDLATRLTVTTAGLLRVVDAPLTGSLTDAAAGRLSIMVGADSIAFAESAPLLGILGCPVALGPVGAGQQAFACEQLLVGATMMAVAEASLIAERSGLDVDRLLTGWGSSLAGSRVLDLARDRLRRKGLPPEVPARGMSDGLAMAVVEAERAAVRLDLLAPVAGFFSRLDRAGLDDHDLTSASELVARHNDRRLEVEDRRLDREPEPG